MHTTGDTRSVNSPFLELKKITRVAIGTSISAVLWTHLLARSIRRRFPLLRHFLKRLTTTGRVALFCVSNSRLSAHLSTQRIVTCYGFEAVPKSTRSLKGPEMTLLGAWRRRDRRRPLPLANSAPRFVVGKHHVLNLRANSSTIGPSAVRAVERGNPVRRQGAVVVDSPLLGQLRHWVQLVLDHADHGRRAH